jgi:hypothetical protein
MNRSFSYASVRVTHHSERGISSGAAQRDRYRETRMAQPIRPPTFAVYHSCDADFRGSNRPASITVLGLSDYALCDGVVHMLGVVVSATRACAQFKHFIMFHLFARCRASPKLPPPPDPRHEASPARPCLPSDPGIGLEIVADVGPGVAITHPQIGRGARHRTRPIRTQPGT